MLHADVQSAAQTPEQAAALKEAAAVKEIASLKSELTLVTGMVVEVRCSAL